MIMKKLNNRQNQIKSLDFQQNILFNCNTQTLTLIQNIVSLYSQSIVVVTTVESVIHAEQH